MHDNFEQYTNTAGRVDRAAKICVIMNSGSGKRDTAIVPDQIRAAFGRSNTPFVLDLVEKGSELSDRAAAAAAKGFSTIVAAGGDGTICAVASALRNTACTLGIVPLGTFNYFARSLDIPQDIDASVDIILGGSTKKIPVATVNDRVFLNNASFGAYPEILKNREDIYKRWGRSRIAAYWSVLKTLIMLRRPLRLDIDADGEARSLRTPLIFAVNNAFQLDQIGLEGRDEIAAGRLVIFISPDSGRWGMLRHALEIATGTAQEDRNYERISARRLKIQSRRRTQLVACDGERMRLGGPFTLEVHDDAVTVAVPEKRRGDVR